MEKKELSVFKAMRRIVPMIFGEVPVWSVIYMVSALLMGVSYGIAAPVNQRLYDALAQLALGDGILRSVYVGAVMVTGVMIFQQVAGSAFNFIMTNVMYYIVDIRLRRLYHAKIKTLPAQIFEDKVKLDDLEKCDYGILGSGFMYRFLLNIVFFYGTFFVIMAAFLFNTQPILIFAIFLAFVPSIMGQFIEAKFYAKLEEESSPLRRQNAHYSECLAGLKILKETRLFGAYYFFKKLFMETLELLAQKEWNNQNKVQAMYLVINGLKAAGWLGILILLFRGLMRGEISVGAFAAVFGSIGMLFGITEDLFANLKHNITEQLGKIHNFINVIEIPTAQGSNTPPDFKSHGVTAKNISFAYAGAEKNAVDDVTLSVRPGETIALVGENGSGKTTLVKLLCGLYKPDKGTVSIGGTDSAHTSDDALFSKSSGVFQNYMQYGLTLEENIKISEYKSKNSVIPSMDEADVDHKDEKTFPNGLETLMSRDLDGTDISGGQWQRVATARGLFRTHDFIVLDEPTAAIDPLEETRIYKRFAELTKSKIAILVTHRLGSARIADRIIVMDNGKIAESGTHESLLTLPGGKYAEMWEAQAESYSEIKYDMP
ncbi:MAG: ABC transporter ATP-binding protein/permease [Clostridiales bacterium]|jgi:ATP-binding cassette subfamily B protein|nr:ABC transporter ATP-binding protein/permease [Clostridiales bacterium]